MNAGIPQRLDTKTSFPDYMKTLILIYILWLFNDRKSEFSYAEEYMNDENVPKIRFTTSEQGYIKNYLNIQITETPNFLTNNALLVQQIESLQTGLLNFLKVGKIGFTLIDQSDNSEPKKRPNTAEREQGIRFQKKICVTTVIDSLDHALTLSNKDFKGLFLDILETNESKVGLEKLKNQYKDNEIYNFLIFFISFWAEQTRFKDKAGNIHDNILDVAIPELELHDRGPARVVNKILANKQYYYLLLDESSKKEFSARIRLFSSIFKPVYLGESAAVEGIDESSSDFEDPNFLEIEKLPDLPKNILIKGVPGTGKSRTIDGIIQKNFSPDTILRDVANNRIERFLRINIHSATTNASLMQGVSVGTDGTHLIYSEKKGLILSFLLTAILYPHYPFALILEEIQENTLNNLIGDLIYLMEPSKRSNLKKYSERIQPDIDPYEFIESVIESESNINFVSIPNLIETSKKSLTKKLVFPDNLFLFCTSNYRDDKKIIEDNLLRRFEVIEIYPNSALIRNDMIRPFFESLNNAILDTVDADLADKYLIGHANWIDVECDESFYRAILKTVIELKDIRGLDFDVVSEILGKCVIPEGIPLAESAKNFYDLISYLQEKSNYEFL